MDCDLGKIEGVCLDTDGGSTRYTVPRRRLVTTIYTSAQISAAHAQSLRVITRSILAPAYSLAAASTRKVERTSLMDLPARFHSSGDASICSTCSAPSRTAHASSTTFEGRHTVAIVSSHLSAGSARSKV